MSETKKSTMGPRRLFILLALGAGVFYYLSTVEEKVEEGENQDDIVVLDPSDTSYLFIA